jgi:hypothetical protein
MMFKITEESSRHVESIAIPVLVDLPGTTARLVSFLECTRRADARANVARLEKSGNYLPTLVSEGLALWMVVCQLK